MPPTRAAGFSPFGGFLFSSSCFSSPRQRFLSVFVSLNPTYSCQQNRPHRRLVSDTGAGPAAYAFLLHGLFASTRLEHLVILAPDAFRACAAFVNNPYHARKNRPLHLFHYLCIFILQRTGYSGTIPDTLAIYTLAVSSARRQRHFCPLRPALRFFRPAIFRIAPHATFFTYSTGLRME